MVIGNLILNMILRRLIRIVYAKGNLYIFLDIQRY